MNEVSTAQLAAAARQIVLALGGYAMGRGWLQADTLTALATVAAVVIPLIWGQASTRKLAKK